jgi:hypothetical protein
MGSWHSHKAILTGAKRGTDDPRRCRLRGVGGDTNVLVDRYVEVTRSRGWGVSGRGGWSLL